ncbi:TPA: DUF262 domain-containing protein [Vibrio cholerae]|uniref:DUF262 domain-containing protein n=1 Tax=Vibrio cholerae TaxID=666 RepID=UPI00166829B6|nr:DUF262 domain-containing protein [Vibrio cholerae]MBD1178208.1 DUF262 domain-containing protein [Vibrio cholerae]
MDIKAEVKSVERLKDYFFVVPDYQREYVWKVDDQVEQFLIDIDNEYVPGARDQASYFIGSIIIVQNGEKHDVIDGQQRLTTLVISLCALRDLLRSCDGGEQQLQANDRKLLAKVEEWLSDFDIKSDQMMPRLELQYDESSDFLSQLIENKSFQGQATGSITKMQQAYQRIWNHFAGYQHQSISELMAYARYFLTGIDLVVIESENLSSALKIFETINQRGAGLNAMDLVKNLMFSQAKESQFGQIKTIWKQITDNLQQCGEGDKPLRFLRYFMQARYHNGILREDELYKWIISKEGKDALQFEAEPVALVKELERMSLRYAELVNATNNANNHREVSRYPSVVNIGYINKYRSRQHLVLLMALDANCPDEVLEYLACQLESFFFFANTLSLQTKTYEQRFTQWAAKLRGARDTETVAIVLESTLVAFIRHRLHEFKQAFEHINHTHYNPQYRERFILGKLENEIRRQCGLVAKSQSMIQQMQIEHILPSTVRNLELSEHFDDVISHILYKPKLGNVTLLESTINQAINKCNDLATDWFTQKQKAYTRSDCVMTNLLAHDYEIGSDTALNRYKLKSGYKFEQWTPQTIDARQRLLMDLAMDAWRFNGQRIDKQPDETEQEAVAVQV